METDKETKAGQPDLLQLIRAAMKNPSKSKETKSSAKQGPTTVSKRTKTAELEKVHGKLGDFSRSNSNPTSRSIPTSATVGYEEVPKTRMNKKDSNNPNNVVLEAETEMIRKAVRIALNNTGGAPSKRAVKQMASPKMTRSDRVFAAGNGCGPGSSKSPTLDAIKAIAAKETGCIVREQMKGKEPLSLRQSQKNANTTQGNYNPMIIEPIKKSK